MVTLKMAENDYSEQEVELLKDKKALKKQLIEEKFAHEEEMKAIHMVTMLFQILMISVWCKISLTSIYVMSLFKIKHTVVTLIEK